MKNSIFISTALQTWRLDHARNVTVICMPLCAKFVVAMF